MPHIQYPPRRRHAGPPRPLQAPPRRRLVLQLQPRRAPAIPVPHPTPYGVLTAQPEHDRRRQHRAAHWTLIACWRLSPAMQPVFLLEAIGRALCRGRAGVHNGQKNIVDSNDHFHLRFLSRTFDYHRDRKVRSHVCFRELCSPPRRHERVTLQPIQEAVPRPGRDRSVRPSGIVLLYEVNFHLGV